MPLDSIIDKIVLDNLKKEGFENPEAELERIKRENARITQLKQELNRQYNMLNPAIREAGYRNSLIERLNEMQRQCQSVYPTPLKVTKRALSEHLSWSSSRYNEYTKGGFVSSVLDAIKEARLGTSVYLEATAGTYSASSTGDGNRPFAYGTKQVGGTYTLFILDATPYLFKDGAIEFHFEGFNYPDNHIESEAYIALSIYQGKLIHEIEKGERLNLNGDELERFVDNGYQEN